MMEDLKKFVILVVDDEELLKNSIVFDFQRKGFTVFSAGNAADAFEIVKTQQVHLVISDVRMPGGDGISLLEQIRVYDPHTPIVIFITGFADVTEAECIAKGARRVLVKPFDRKVLMNSVLEILGISMVS